MATLQFVREAKDSNLLLLGVVEEEGAVSYTVNLSLFREIGMPSSGAELDASQMSAIKYTDKLIKAKKKALNILAYADNSRKNLGLKLYRAGFEREIIDEVCSEMVKLGYINERGQLERLILIEANTKLRGPMKIIPALVSKGYSQGEIREVLDDLVKEGEIDFRENSKKLLEKKLSAPYDEEEAKKILYKNGFKI